MATAQEFKSTFHEGMNSDVSPLLQPQGQYRLAQNLALVGDGQLGALQDIKGTSFIEEVIAAGSPIGEVNTIMGVFKVTLRNEDGGGENEGLLVAVYTSTVSPFELRFYTINLNSPGTYSGLLYTQELDTNYDSFVLDPRNRVSGVLYTEADRDVLYLTDGYTDHLWKFNLNLPSILSSNHYVDRDVRLPKEAAIGTLEMDSILDNGSLLTGSYQIAYQLVNSTNGRFTRFSLLTNPIHIYSTIDGRPHSGPGIPSNSSIRLSLMLADEEADHYDGVRFAVVENIYPEGGAPLTAGLTDVRPLPSGAGFHQFEITTNYQKETIPIEDIVIDTAALETVKTLEVVDNRLIFGNVKLKELELDNANGTPVAGGGTFIQQVEDVNTNDSFSRADFSSWYKGYFRDETYRFAIVYFDKYGNYSEPFPLDLSSVQDNQIASPYTDVRFPHRSYQAGGRFYTPLNTANQTVSLGLQIENIDNHPTWARGFIIVRAKRKKRILFQTPVIPLAGYRGIGALGEYPTIRREGNPAQSVTDTNATPMVSTSVWMPSSLWYGKYATADLVAPINNAGVYFTNQNAGLYGISKLPNLHAIYPPETMYTKSPYQFTGGESLLVTDACICRGLVNNFGTNASTYYDGTGIETQRSVTWFATRLDDYFYDDGSPKTALTSYHPENPVKDYKNLDNYSEGVVMAGSRICTFSDLKTGGTPFGTQPTTNRFTAITTAKSYDVFNAFSGGQSITIANGPPAGVSVTGTALNDNTFVTAGTSGLISTESNTIEIVNVINGTMDDNRYTSDDDSNEYIFTGTKVLFDSSERADIEAGNPVPKTVNVWGGDCIVSLHTFKIADTTYAITNQEKSYKYFEQGGVGGSPTIATLIAKWGRIYAERSGATTGLCMPVGYQVAAQYLAVVLESEFHGSVRDIDNHELLYNSNDFLVLGAGKKELALSPLTYNGDINLAKENDQKLFFITDPLTKRSSSYPARMYYSDKKIYQTSQEGFDFVRVGNYFDLEERYGQLSRLVLSGGNLYGIQETGISYIPTSEKIVELSDTSQLGVRSGDIFGAPNYLTTTKGGSSVDCVVTTGEGFYVADVINKGVYFITGTQFDIVSERGVATMVRELFNGILGLGNYAHCHYDALHKELWVHGTGNTYEDVGPTFCLVYSERAQRWISVYDLGIDIAWMGATHDKVYLLNRQDTIELHSMYTGSQGRFFGVDKLPFVKIAINPSPDQSKVFDDLAVNASNRLDSFDLLVLREASETNQSSFGTSLNVTPREEAIYRVKTLRDSTGARMRGQYALMTLKWDSGVGVNQATLFSASTRFRPSS